MRSAGSLCDVVFLGGPNLQASFIGSSGGIVLFAYQASTRRYLGSKLFMQYRNIRSWAAWDGCAPPFSPPVPVGESMKGKKCSPANEWSCLVWSLWNGVTCIRVRTSSSSLLQQAVFKETQLARRMPRCWSSSPPSFSSDPPPPHCRWRHRSSPATTTIISTITTIAGRPPALAPLPAAAAALSSSEHSRRLAAPAAWSSGQGRSRTHSSSRRRAQMGSCSDPPPRRFLQLLLVSSAAAHDTDA